MEMALLTCMPNVALHTHLSKHSVLLILVEAAYSLKIEIRIINFKTTGKIINEQCADRNTTQAKNNFVFFPPLCL